MDVAVNLLKRFSKNRRAYDIFIVKEKTINVFIFLKEKDSSFVNEIKKVLEKSVPENTVHAIYPEDVFTSEFTQSIVLSGFSIKNNKKASNKLRQCILITYCLENLSHSKKTMFGYALKGRQKEKGLIHALGGETIGRNSILIPSENIHSAAEFFEYWQVKYSTKKIIDLETPGEKEDV